MLIKWGDDSNRSSPHFAWQIAQLDRDRISTCGTL